MVVHIRTVAFQGIDVVNIGVQMQIANGLLGFQVVGLPNDAIANRLADVFDMT